MIRDNTPAAVFVTIVNEIETRLKDAGRPRTLHEPRQANRLRAALFQLEGWARLHRNWPNEEEQKFFRRLRDQAKEIEDVLGATDTANSLLTEASAKDIPLLVRYLADELHEREKDLKRVLHENDWMAKEGRSRTDKLLEKLTAVGWPSAEVQIDYLGGEIAKEIAGFEKRFEDEIRPELTKSVYLHETVENFVHEWRRQIRWYAIYLQTGRGLFGLKEAPAKLSAPETQLLDEMSDNAFATLPTNANTRVKVDRVAYFELTRLIDKLGKAKEAAETFFFMKERLLASGAVQTEAKADTFARKLYGDIPEQTPKAVRALLAENDKFKPLEKLKRDIAPKEISK